MTDAIFKSAQDVSYFLQLAGYKVKKTKVYDDALKGVLIRQLDGTILKADVEAYAQGLPRLDGVEFEIDYSFILMFRADLSREIRKLISLRRMINELLEFRKNKRKAASVHACQCGKVAAAASSGGQAAETEAELDECGCDKWV